MSTGKSLKKVDLEYLLVDVGAPEPLVVVEINNLLNWLRGKSGDKDNLLEIAREIEDSVDEKTREELLRTFKSEVVQ